MITACKDELPNPHKNCLREILNALVVHHNDYRRMKSEMRNLQAELKDEMHTMEFPCSELRKLICCSQFDNTEGENFLKRVGRVNEVYSCFTQRIEKLEEKIKTTADNARNCIIALNTAKTSLKRFHERTVDHLKRTAIMSTDVQVVANCEKDICEMHRRFLKEVSFIKKVECELQPFFEQLKASAPDVDSQLYTNCECLKQYDWIPADRGLSAVDGIADAIKTQMGSTLVKAFAQVHVHQPSDVKGFLASYLLNFERNEKLLQEKMQLLGNVETVTCETVFDTSISTRVDMLTPAIEVYKPPL